MFIEKRKREVCVCVCVGCAVMKGCLSASQEIATTWTLDKTAAALHLLLTKQPNNIACLNLVEFP